MGTIDQGFVPAPPGAVYARLANVAAYPEWWPRAQWSGDSRLTIGGVRGAAVTVESERADTGLVLRLAGGTSGSLEWYLEPFKDGTMVNAILDLDASAARAERTRAALRDGMVALRRLAEAS